VFDVLFVDDDEVFDVIDDVDVFIGVYCG